MNTFSVIDDHRLCTAIKRAKSKLVFVAPGVSKEVATELSRRLDDIGHLSVTVILDTDPEVCRLGFGDLDALKDLKDRADHSQLALRSQPGLRIGLLIADDDIVVYSPVPRLVEAGSRVESKPNAIVIDASNVPAIESACGAEGSDRLATEGEIGRQVVTDTEVKRTEDDLRDAPPQKFDLARQARVFSSRLCFVELETTGIGVNTRRLRLPKDLMNVDADESLLNQLDSHVRPLGDDTNLGVTLCVKEDGFVKTTKSEQADSIEYTPEKLKNEIQKLRADYLFTLPRFGSLIYTAQRDEFGEKCLAFETRLKKYLELLSYKLKEQSQAQIDRVTDLVIERHRGKPPQGMKPKDYPNGISPDEIRLYIRRRVTPAYEKTFTVKGDVNLVFKAISPASIEGNDGFLKALSRKIPPEKWALIFDKFEAARAGDD